MARALTFSRAQRSCWAVAFALLVAMRLLTPAGFMPSWSNGQLQIALCEDTAAPLHHGDHGKKDAPKHRESCPFAAASATPFLTSPEIAVEPPPAPEAFAAASLAEFDLASPRKIERPPSRAPPALA